MWRFIPALTVGALLWVGLPTQAQPAPNKDEAKRLEVQLERLRNQIKEVEARLKQLREGTAEKTPAGEIDSAKRKELRAQLEKMREQAQKDGKPFDPAKVKELREQYQKWAEAARAGAAKKAGEKKDAGKKDAPAFGPPWARHDPATMQAMRERFEKMRAQAQKEGKRFAGPWGPPWGPPRFGGDRAVPKPTARDASVEARLDRLAREIDEIRAELKKSKK